MTLNSPMESFRRILVILAVGMLGVLAPSCKRVGEGAPPETLFSDEYDEEAMDAAMEAAQRSVSIFVAKLDSPGTSDHAVKMRIEDGEQVEYFWVSEVSYEGGRFTGRISNEAGLVSNVTMGQTVSVDENEISDWMYLSAGKMHGNYTLRVLLPEMPEDQADHFRRIMAPLPE